MNSTPTTSAGTISPVAPPEPAVDPDAADRADDAERLDTLREVLTRPRPSPAERQKVRDQDRLLHDTYPGEYVAYRDIWDGLTFVRREVLVHDPDLGAVNDPLMAKYSDRELDAIRVTYCEPLELRGKIVLRDRPKLPTASE